MPDSMQPGSTLIPSLRYHDAPAAIDWLEQVLGFTRHAVYPGENNIVQHAELRLGNGMVMLGSAANKVPNPHLVATPDEAGNRVTSAVYVIVPDCQPVWQRAQAAGAKIIMELQVMSYGGHAFAVLDPEGYIWSLGEYDPWKALEAAASGDSASQGA